MQVARDIGDHVGFTALQCCCMLFFFHSATSGFAFEVPLFLDSLF